MLKTLGIWGIAGAILFHAWRSKMTKSEFLSSVSASIASLGVSLGSIANAIQNHPAASNPEFDPDGRLANTASQLQTLATEAQQAADALNPATPGGVNDTTPDATAGATSQTAPSDPAAANTTVTTPPQTADQATAAMTNTDPSQTDTSGLGDAGASQGADVSGQTLGDAGLQPSATPSDAPAALSGGDDTGDTEGTPV